MNQVHIDYLTVRSLRLCLLCNGYQISTATGFLVSHNEAFYLVSNYHVLSGRNADTDEPMDKSAGLPDTVAIYHNKKNSLGNWEIRYEHLIDAMGNSRILIHPRGGKIDVALLPLTSLDDIELYATDLELQNEPIPLPPTAAISIIGFPFGIASAGSFPIWKSGTVASEHGLNFQGVPQFLIDSTGRPGMSGSPVYARRLGIYQHESGTNVVFHGIKDRFLGIYAGRIDNHSEIGRVFRPSTIRDILSALG